MLCDYAFSVNSKKFFWILLSVLMVTLSPIIIRINFWSSSISPDLRIRYRALKIAGINYGKHEENTVTKRKLVSKHLKPVITTLLYQNIQTTQLHLHQTKPPTLSPNSASNPSAGDIHNRNRNHNHNYTNPKVVYGATDLWQGQLWKELMNFQGCDYANCVGANSSTFKKIEDSDVVLFADNYVTKFPKLPWKIRANQHWLVLSYESSAYSYNRFKAKMNNQFNGSMSFRRDSMLYYPWGKTVRLQQELPNYINFAEGKYKGAYAYISNCESQNYKRLELVKRLSRYIDIDVFGKCGTKPLCPRMKKGDNPKCEARIHETYRFVLTFENSLCKDYITEKFWDHLQSPGHFLPVAMGGLSAEEYSSVAPKDSFLHVYNFTSVDELGKYLRHLSHNDEAYNRYHRWRSTHSITTDRNIAACELCKMANEKRHKPAVRTMTEWWNGAKYCRTYIG